jgi:hypothetical protein
VKSLFVMMFLFLATAVVARSPTIRLIDAARLGVIEISVFCDAPRGNIVYTTFGTNGSPGIAVVHRPDICK